MLGSSVPSPQAVHDAATFLEVIKLAGSKDVAAVIARMEELNSEAGSRLERAQQTEIDVVAQRAELAKESTALGGKREEAEAAVAAAKRVTADAEADRAKAASTLEDARGKAHMIAREAEAARKAAEQLRADAQVDRDAAAKALGDAETARREADALRAQWEAKAGALREVIAG